jgi:hypothetical protein
MLSTGVQSVERIELWGVCSYNNFAAIAHRNESFRTEFMQQYIATSRESSLKRIRRIVKTRMNNARVATRRMGSQPSFFVKNDYLSVGRHRKNRISDRKTDYTAAHDGEITRRHSGTN